MAGIARMAKRQSEQLIGSILKLEDLAECIMLTDVTGFVVELDDPTGQYVMDWVKYGVMDIPIRITYLNGSPFLRARYSSRTRKLNVYAAGDDEENILFSLETNAPASAKYLQHPAAKLAGLTPGNVEKKLSMVMPHQAMEIAKMKHKTGLTVYRINKPLAPAPGNAAYDLQVVRTNQATIPFLDMRVENTCCYSLLHWLGLAFDKSQFALYKRDQYIGMVSPKIGFGPSQLGYVVKFEDVPSPAHVSKAIVLASTMLMLLNLSPMGGTDMVEE